MFWPATFKFAPQRSVCALSIESEKQEGKPLGVHFNEVSF